MRILQIIDSLEAGGAERMAVNYANALVGKIEESHLCSTRKEGILKDKLSDDVGYFFLNKSGIFDVFAFNRLDKYIYNNRIDIVQAHSSSWFLVTLIKMFRRRSIGIVWHDHYGNSEFLKNRPKKILRFFSVYFNGIITVNTDLENWSRKNLKCEKVTTFRNFLTEDKFSFDLTGYQLKGRVQDFKLICVANLRPQKDHLTLITAFNNLKIENVSLHLIGKNFQDDYYNEINIAIKNSPKSDRYFLLWNQG